MAALRMTLNPPTEAEEQMAFIDMCWKRAPDYPTLALVYHISNGAFLGANRQRYGFKLGLLGVKPGVPDLCLPVARNGFHGLYIELKRRNASPSDTKPEQLTWHEHLRAQGYRVEVCKGWTAAWNTLCDYLTELKGLEVL